METKSNYIEKRKSYRAQAEIPLKIDLSGPAYTEAETIDLSEEGLRLSMIGNEQLPKDFVLQFNLPSPFQRVKMHAEVIWNNGLHYGMRFKQLEKEQAKEVKRVLWQSENYIENNLNDLLNKVKPLIPGMGNLIKNFFINDVRKYLGEIEFLYSEITERKLAEDKGQVEIDRETNEITQKGNSLEKILDSKMLSKEVKNIFRSMVGGCLYESTLAKRFFEKPRGYPGDCKMLEAIYDNRPGSEGIGYYLDKFFLNNSYAPPVRNRKDKMVNILQNFLKSSNLPSIKILNLASGSCREIKELFTRPSMFGGEVKITCIDHDEEALDFSRCNIGNLPSNVKVDFIKENILSMSERQECYLESLGNQNLIYSLGLIDYVPDRILKRLIKFWHNLLAPSGQLVLTHKDRDNDSGAYLVPDWLCDWKFIPRNEEHFVNLVKATIEGNYSLEIDRDVSKKIVFLFVTKNKRTLSYFLTGQIAEFLNSP